MQIEIIKSIYSDFDTIPLKQNQLIYATDNKSTVFDIDDKLRFSLSCTRQYDSEDERIAITTPEENVIYIVVDNNRMYRYYKDLGWLIVTDFEAVQDIIISAEELIPMVIETNGIKYAPKTLAQYIYMNDGTTLQNAIDELTARGSKVILETKTQPIQLKYDKQKVVDIPYPIPDYNIYKFPMLVLLRREKIDVDMYAISNEQLIFTDSIADTNKKDDLVTFIFVYAHTLADSSLDCESINGVRIFKGKTDIALDLRQDKDLMINTKYCEMKEWHHDTQEWELIFSNRKRLVRRIEKSKTFTEPTNYCDIEIDGFDQTLDTLFVYKNGCKFVNGTDYVISADSKFIKHPSGSTWETNDKNVFEFTVFKNLPPAEYYEYDDDKFNENEMVNIKSEVADLRAEVIALKDIINKFTP